MPVELESGSVDLRFGYADTEEMRARAAQDFVTRHKLQSGSGCERENCVSSRIEEQMTGKLAKTTYYAVLEG